MAASPDVEVEMNGELVRRKAETPETPPETPRREDDGERERRAGAATAAGMDGTLSASMAEVLRSARAGAAGAPAYKPFYTPKEVAEAVAAAGSAKGHYSAVRTLALGTLAGLFLSFGGAFSIAVGGAFSAAEGGLAVGLSRLTFAGVFPMGLLLIVLYQAELFTGNCMYLTAAWNSGRITMRQLLSNWLWAYVGNAAGSVLFAYFLSYLTGLFDDEPWRTFVCALAEKKAASSSAKFWWKTFLKGIGANYLVNLALFSSLSASSVSSRFVALYFPIMCFVAVGFEHSIANWFLLPNGILYGADLTMLDAVWRNLIPVTLGNIVSGVFMGVTTHYLYAA